MTSLPSPPPYPLAPPPYPLAPPLLAGIIGGKFLERGRIAKPKRDRDEPSVYHLAEDFYVGGHVVLNNHKFILIDADEYALKYMEKHDQVRVSYTINPSISNQGYVRVTYTLTYIRNYVPLSTSCDM